MVAVITPAVVAELVRIHRPTTTYQGLSPAGLLHLAAGGVIGPDDMPISRGMVGHRTCMACRSPRDIAQAWPCETVKLLLEAGEISTVPAEWRAA